MSVYIQYPVRLRLQIVGAERDGHTFQLSIEDLAPDLVMVDGEDALTPWLRPTCSCGWAADERFVIEENAHWRWHKHIDEDETPVVEGNSASLTRRIEEALIRRHPVTLSRGRARNYAELAAFVAQDQ